MIPKFMAGEAFYRVMRSPEARTRIASLVDPGLVAAGRTRLIGANASASSRRRQIPQGR